MNDTTRNLLLAYRANLSLDTLMVAADSLEEQGDERADLLRKCKITNELLRVNNLIQVQSWVAHFPRDNGEMGRVGTDEESGAILHILSRVDDWFPELKGRKSLPAELYGIPIVVEKMRRIENKTK